MAEVAGMTDAKADPPAQPAVEERGDGVEFQDISDVSVVAQNMEKLLADKHTSDITLLVGAKNDIQLPAHRCILASGSPVFRAMLYGAGWAEGAMAEVKLNPEFTDTTMRIVLQFIYTGSCRLTTVTALPVLCCASHFALDRLELLATAFIRRHVSEHNCCELLQTARNFGQQSLADQCFEFVQSHAESVLLHQPGFLELEVSILIKLFASSETRAPEISLFEAAMRWVKHEGNSVTAEEKKDLFSMIRYPLIAPGDLVAIVRPTGMAPMELYVTALERHVAPDQAVLVVDDPQFTRRWMPIEWETVTGAGFLSNNNHSFIKRGKRGWNTFARTSLLAPGKHHLTLTIDHVNPDCSGTVIGLVSDDSQAHVDCVGIGGGGKVYGTPTRIDGTVSLSQNMSVQMMLDTDAHTVSFVESNCLWSIELSYADRCTASQSHQAPPWENVYFGAFLHYENDQVSLSNRSDDY